MTLYKKKFAAVFIFAAALFIAVISGGCGGGSSSFIPGGDSEIDNVNEILTGGWRIKSASTNNVSVDLDGTTVNLAIRDFAVKFENVDVEDTTGTANFQAIAVLSSDRALIPLAFDTAKANTIRGGNEWLITTEHEYLLNLTLLDNGDIRISGIIRVIGDNMAFADITLSKPSETFKTESEMNALINGNWQTPMTNSAPVGGGFIFVSRDVGQDNNSSAPEGDIPPELLRVPGMSEIDGTFMSLNFKNTSISGTKTTSSALGFLAFLNESKDWAGDGPLQLMIEDEKDAKISHVFNDIYKIEFASNDKAVLMINGNEAYLISSSYQTTANNYSEVHALFPLEKKPDTSTVAITDYIGTVWSSYFAAAQAINFTTSSSVVKDLNMQSLFLAFPEGSADITALKFGALINAKYAEMGAPDVSPDMKNLNAALELVNVKQIAYNTWYASDASGSSEIAISLFETDTEIVAFVMANLTSGLIGSDYISLAAFMIEQGEMEDVFFKGAWTHRQGDKASVQFVASDRPSTPINAELINFGAYFSSVDINAGTANFSAVSLLAFDNPLNPGNNVFTPMVYDRVPVNVNSTDTPGIYKVTTENGSNFTVQVLSPDSDGTMRANLSGVIKYESLGFNISIDAEVTKSDNESATVDFDSVMKDSTWQTTLADSANSGGFVVMPNAQVQYPYIAANPGQTMASLSFKGDSNNAAATGFGIMNTSAGTIPLTLLNLPLSVQHMFNNFYRFDFTSGDQGIKGVCVLSDDKSSKLILEADHKLGTNELKMHVLLSLTKLTSSSEQDIRQWIGTSWTKEHTGGFLVSGDNSLRFSDMTEYNPELILDSFDVTFGQPIGTNTIDFSANITLHRSGSDVMNLPFSGNVDVYDAGVNMWYGIAQANHSQFILTIIKDEMGSGYHVILSANLNVPFNGNYYFVSLAGTMVQK